MGQVGQTAILPDQAGHGAEQTGHGWLGRHLVRVLGSARAMSPRVWHRHVAAARAVVGVVVGEDPAGRGGVPARQPGVQEEGELGGYDDDGAQLHEQGQGACEGHAGGQVGKVGGHGRGRADRRAS